MNGWPDWLKNLANLGAVGFVLALCAFLAWHLVEEVRPALLAVPSIAAEMREHRGAEDESLRVLRLICRGVQKNPEACEQPARQRGGW